MICRGAVNCAADTAAAEPLGIAHHDADVVGPGSFANDQDGVL